MALMQEYERIIEDKSFNSYFYNKGRLEEVKALITCQLIYHEKKCLIEISSLRVKESLFFLKRFGLLMEAKRMYVPLMQKIEHEESIHGYEYEKCYMELYYGPFKLKQILIMLLICVGFILAKWCLGYFGLLS